MLTVSLLLAIFLGSLVSGWHCALMCGGIAAAIERPAVVSARINSRSELFFLQLIMHLGRLTTYMLLGASCLGGGGYLATRPYPSPAPSIRLYCPYFGVDGDSSLMEAASHSGLSRQVVWGKNSKLLGPLLWANG